MSESDDSAQRDELREQLPWPADESYESEESDDDDIVRVGGAVTTERGDFDEGKSLRLPACLAACLRACLITSRVELRRVEG